MYGLDNPELLHLFLERIPVAVAIFDRQMRYLLANSQWLTDYDLDNQHIIGRAHYEIFPETSVHWQLIHERCLAGVVEQGKQDCCGRHNSATASLKWEIHPWHHSSGEIGGIVIFAEVSTVARQINDECDEFVVRQCDRTVAGEIDQRLETDAATHANMAVALQELQREVIDCQQTEAALRASEARLSSLAANMPGVIYQFLLRPDGSKIFPYMSSGCRDMFELEPEVIQQGTEPLWALFHPEDLQSLEESIASSAETLTPWYKELRFITPSGKIKWFQGASRPQRLEGGEILWDGLLLDITKRKQAEAQVRRYKEHLEELVVERTDALAKANETLQQEIIERQQAELALQQSEARFQKLAANVPGMIYQYVLSPDGSHYFSYISAGCRELYEREPEEIQQNVNCTFDQVHPDDWQDLNRSIRVSAENLQPWDWEWRLIMPSGQIKWLQARSRPEKQANGEILWDGVVIDITERKNAEKALQESYNLLHSILESIPDIVFVKDFQGRYIMLNPAFAHFFGKPIEELIGKDDIELLPSTAHQIREKDLKIMTVGVAETFEELIRNNGHSQTFLTTKSPWRNPQGNIIGLIAISRNITERKQAEEALRLSEARFRELAQREELLNRLASQIRSSLDLNTILKTALHEIYNLLQPDRCFFAWYRPEKEAPYWEVVQEARNLELSSLIDFRSSVAELEPMSEKALNKEIIRVEDSGLLTAPVERQFFLSSGHTATLILPIHTQSGEIGILCCTHSSEPRYWSDTEVELLQAVADNLAIAIDQAELLRQSRTAAEIAQAQTQQLEQTLQALRKAQTHLVQSEKMSSLGQMVAGVAHEINNPVNFIYGNLVHASEYTTEILSLVQLYQQEYPLPTLKIHEKIAAIDLDFLIEDLPKLLSSMRVGAERIREIVCSLRNFSRLDEAAMKAVDIHEGIESTLLILQNRLKMKPDRPAIQVIKEYGNLPPVECYAGQLNQVFMNLLVNAIDILDEDKEQRAPSDIKANPSTITIKTEVRTEGHAPGGSPQRVAIRIADNGPGITEEVRKQMFNPFFTTKPVGKGTGLGLAISYQIIVEKHGGILKCVSPSGQGAEFLIEIPLRQGR